MKNIVHWCKPKKMWTSHTYKSCTKSLNILINGNWFSEVKPQKKSNPRGWIVTDHTNVIVDPNENDLVGFRVGDRVIFDKVNVSFSHLEGKYILFNEDGCFILEKEEVS